MVAGQGQGAGLEDLHHPVEEGFHAVDPDHVGKPDPVADVAVVPVHEVPVVVGVVARDDEEDLTLAAGRSHCVNTYW